MTRHHHQRVGGFDIHALASDTVSVSIAPELGGRIVSIRHQPTGREWLDGWEPADARRLHHPADPANYETGPGAGVDECLPTVLPCVSEGVAHNDHGEIWNQDADFDTTAATGGILACKWALRRTPLDFERRVSLDGDRIRLDYRLTNRANCPTPFLWAWHPLFSWQPGDQILTREANCLSTGGERLPWPSPTPGTDLSRALFPADATPAAKVFLGPLATGRAAILATNGACLTLEWPATQFPWAGIWITRGFWKNLHHWAIEPTNAPVDRLSDILHHSPTTRLDPGEIRQWKLEIQCTSEPTVPDS